MTALPAAPADILATHGGGFTGALIRLGNTIRGRPAPAGHVIVVTHQDALGRWIGIQGQPGGVGLADCTPALNDPYTRSNHGQPRDGSNGQLIAFLASAAKSIGTRYDWVGIAEDVDVVLGAQNLAALIDPLWRWPSDHGLLPGHVVCSSLAAMLYDLPAVGWAHPALGTERMCTPGDWWRWNAEESWAKPH